MTQTYEVPVVLGGLEIIKKSDDLPPSLVSNDRDSEIVDFGSDSINQSSSSTHSIVLNELAMTEPASALEKPSENTNSILNETNSVEPLDKEPSVFSFASSSLFSRTQRKLPLSQPTDQTTLTATSEQIYTTTKTVISGPFSFTDTGPEAATEEDVTITSSNEGQTQKDKQYEDPKSHESMESFLARIKQRREKVASATSKASFSSSSLARHSNATGLVAVTSEGEVITLDRKVSKQKRNIISDTIPSDAEHENIQVSVNERNPGLTLNRYDTRNQFGIPIHIFKAQFEREQKRKEDELKHQMRKKETEDEMADDDNIQVVSVEINKDKKHSTENSSSQTSNQSTILLTEKYRPNLVIDLVGREKTHRRLLTWLVQWSPLVFNTPISTKRLNTKSDKKPTYDSLNFRDILGRPQKKILLIHGPPGLGKTTVAHVIAKHFRYDVLEINASDERSAATVKDRIRSALSSHSMRASRNPVCVVADEIEGSEGGFVRALIDIIYKDEQAVNKIERMFGRENIGQSSPKDILKRVKAKRHQIQSQAMAEELSNHRSRGKKQNSPQRILDSLLMRPIIAVCNDVYSHSLRSLRPYAEIVPYNRVAPNILVDVLQEICVKEDIDVETKELEQLCMDSECDLRSCLNSLQFSYMNTEEDELTKMSRSLPFSTKTAKDRPKHMPRKDISKSWSSVVTRIFQQVRGVGGSSLNNRGTSSVQMLAHDIKTSSDEAASVMNDILSCGEHDRIVTGTFLAYPHMQFHDDSFTKSICFGDWLFFHERINKMIYTGNPPAGQYLGYTALAAHSMFSNVGNNKGLPSSGFGSNKSSNRSNFLLSERDLYDKQKTSKDLISSLQKTLAATSPDLYHLFNQMDLVETVIPYLFLIVSPNIPKGISDVSHRFSKSTKTSSNTVAPTEAALKIEHTTDIMLDFGLRFVLHKTETMANDFRMGSGSAVYLLDPPIEQLALLDVNLQKTASVGKYDIRHRVVTEMFKRKPVYIENSESSERNFYNRKRGAGNDDSDNKKKKTKVDDDDDESMGNASKGPIKQGGLLGFNFSKTKVRESTPISEGCTEASVQNFKKELAGGTDPETRVWIKFHEGLSNAVRRDLTWERIWC